MANNLSIGVATILIIAALLVGFFFAYGVFPRIKEVKPDKCEAVDCKAVPCEAIDCKPVACEPVEVIVKTTYRDDAVQEFFKKKVLRDNDLLICGENDYDFDQITLKDISDSFSIEAEDELNYEVTTSVKLKYKQSDLKQCFNTVEFKVIYDEDEKPEVTIL